MLSSVLSLSLIGDMPNSVEAEADGPDYWAVHGVSPTDHLNLRRGPSTRFSVVAKIPADFSHLENLGCSPDFPMMDWGRFSKHERDLAISLRWCRVRFHDLEGWVKGSYLQEGVSPSERHSRSE